MTVQDKKVLVTGGTSGIGEATARAYAAAGADVVITGRDEERGRQIVQSLVADGERLAVLVWVAWLRSAKGARNRTAGRSWHCWASRS